MVQPMKIIIMFWALGEVDEKSVLLGDKIRYLARLWNGTLITLMGEPNVNYNSKSKREKLDRNL